MKNLNNTVLSILIISLLLVPVVLQASLLTRSGDVPTDSESTLTIDRNRQRNLLPPSGLTASVIDQINVQLNWQQPTDMIHIFYHDGNPVEGYFQTSSEAYGTVFDLSEYPGATLQYLEFRHSPWGLNGTWEYTILVIDWIEGTLIEAIEDLTTTVNNGWETDIQLNNIAGIDYVGIFILPLGNDPADAFPVIDLDAAMEGESYIITADGYSIVDTAVGDFLIDLWIQIGSGPVRRASAANAALYQVSDAAVTRQNRDDLSGFKVYRNDAVIGEIDNPEELSYYDSDLEDGTYTYHVTALYGNDQSEPSNSVTVTINAGIQILWSDNFESYPDFTFSFPPWTLIDLDGGPTYGFNNVSFPGEYQPMSFIIFNPSETTPPLSGVTPPSGQKVAASFASSSNASNNWMITPQIHLGVDSSVSFMARSYSTQYGLERFRVGVSITEPDPGSFSIISPDQYVTAPVSWTEYAYDLSEYDEQAIYLAINCISDDSWVLFVDDFKVFSSGGSNIEQTNETPLPYLKAGNYPNPFNPETTIEFYLSLEGKTKLEVFNIKGQRIALLVDEYLPAGTHRVNWNGISNEGREVNSGVYLYRITTADNSLTGKMMLLK